MSDYNYNKVVFGNKVILDLTSDTVVPGALLKGYTAHNASGTKITGTYEPPQPVLITKSVTANGTYKASDDIPAANGYSSVTVNVNDTPILKTKTITQNGAYRASSDNADGYSSVTINVPNAPVLKTKSITQNGTYKAEDDNADGYLSVTVNVWTGYITKIDGVIQERNLDFVTSSIPGLYDLVS